MNKKIPSFSDILSDRYDVKISKDIKTALLITEKSVKCSKDAPEIIKKGMYKSIKGAFIHASML